MCSCISTASWCQLTAWTHGIREAQDDCRTRRPTPALLVVFKDKRLGNPGMDEQRQRTANLDHGSRRQVFASISLDSYPLLGLCFDGNAFDDGVYLPVDAEKSIVSRANSAASTVHIIRSNPQSPAHSRSLQSPISPDGSSRGSSRTRVCGEDAADMCA